MLKEKDNKIKVLETTFNSALKEIDYYKELAESKEEDRTRLLKLLEVSCVQKINNERGAGRKERFNQSDKEAMKMYRLQGKSYKEIAELYGCSVGLVHKIINE